MELRYYRSNDFMTIFLHGGRLIFKLRESLVPTKENKVIDGDV